MPCKKKRQWFPITHVCHHGIPLDELEDRLEMQSAAAIESAVACYTDLCPSDCTVHCASGYTGCIDLCACDGSMCAAECASLCAVDSCLVDII
jgi:hypothetical protein